MDETTNRGAERLFTPDELAERWRLTGTTIRAQVLRGEIAAFRIGKNIRIPESEVRRIEDQRAYRIPRAPRRAVAV